MKHIDTRLIASDPAARLAFLEDFVGFTSDDWQALQDSLSVLGPRLPNLLDAVYDQLLSYDDTRRVFLGARGEIDPVYIELRKEHLTTWLLTTVDGRDRAGFAEFVMAVGRRHCGTDGDPSRIVPPRYMVALISFVQTALLATLFDLLPHDPAQVRRLGLAWNKMLLIQLEFFLKAMTPQWPSWDEA